MKKKVTTCVCDKRNFNRWGWDRVRKRRQHKRCGTKKWDQIQLRMSVGLSIQGTDSDRPRTAELMVFSQRRLGGKWKREKMKRVKGEEWELVTESGDSERGRVDMERKLEEMDGMLRGAKDKRGTCREKVTNKTQPPCPTTFWCQNQRGCVWQFLQLSETHAYVGFTQQLSLREKAALFLFLTLLLSLWMCTSLSLRRSCPKVCTIIPICMIPWILPLSMMASFSPQLSRKPFGEATNTFAFRYGWVVLCTNYFVSHIP